MAAKQTPAKRAPAKPKAVIVPAAIDETAPDTTVGVSGAQETKASKKTVKDVQAFAVSGTTSEIVLTIDGELFRFDAQQVLALRGLISGAVINLNY